MTDNNPKPLFTFIVTNWNGEKFIARCLSSLILSAINSHKSFEGIVVDDASTDNSVNIIKNNFPTIKLLINKHNSGFIASTNKGIESANSPLVALINNDIVVEPDFFIEILKPFEEKSLKHQNNGENDAINLTTKYGNVFGVSARAISWDTGEPNHLNMTAHFDNGEIILDFKDSKEISETFFVQGGAGIFQRDVFIKLGGFQSIFHPTYWDDYDLSYLALKCGFKNLYQPSALVHHYGKGSLLYQLGDEGLKITIERNRFLFTWINLTDKNLILKHLLSLPLMISRSIIKDGNFSQLKAFLKALKRLPKALKIRGARKKKLRFPLSDRDILFLKKG